MECQGGTEIENSPQPPRFRISVVVAAVGVVVLVGILLAQIVGWRVAEPAKQPLPTAGCHSTAAHLSVLLVGNSYTYENDLPSVLANVMCRSGIATNLSVQELAAGGATMHGWVANDAASDLPGHDVVVLQEQSQIPGFNVRTPIWRDSQSSITQLAQAATDAHVHVVLFETWGRQRGDATNDWIYPSYPAMQQRISTGYARYLASIRSQAAPDAQIATVGHAWSRVHDDNPQLFDQLYTTDGSHPSMAGTYLAALVLAQSLSHRGLPARLWNPAELTAAQAVALQAAARSSS